MNVNALAANLKSSARYRWFILITVSVGTYMATLDSSITNVALPTISATLHSDLSVLQWVVTAYLLVISSLLPVFGRVADLVGRKRIFASGFLVFALGSLLCGSASSIWMLIATRVLQAIGASMIMANSAAIITAVFPPQERGRALGLTGTVVALGNLSGPAIGGLLLKVASWRSIFYINLPIGILGCLAVLLVLPADLPNKEQESFDKLGAVFFASGMLALLFALNNGQDWGWSSFPIISGLVLGVILLISFYISQTRASHPLIDLSLFRNRPFLIGNLSGFLSFVAMFSNMMLMPFYLQQILHYEPSQVGLFMAAFPLMMAIVAPISGRASDRIGPVALTTTGLVFTSLGLFYLGFFSGPASAFWQLLPGPLLMGIGSGMFQSPNNSNVMSSVPKPKLGTAGGINALVRNVGMVVGIALSVTLFDNRHAALLKGIANPDQIQQSAAFITSYHTVMFTGATVALIAAFISLNRKGYVRAEQAGSGKPH